MIDLLSETCPLCAGTELEPMRPANRYFLCVRCDLRFMRPRFRLSEEDEKARYDLHENDEDCTAYRDFVGPLFHHLQRHVAPPAEGLDFGAGKGPALAKIFTQNGYPMRLYDPFYWPDAAVLDRSYDFVVSSETFEHLYSPADELTRLWRCLKPNAWLAVMTHIFNPEWDFTKWYYPRDPTHVVFYSRQTFSWIAQNWGFADLTFHGERVALLRRPAGTLPLNFPL